MNSEIRGKKDKSAESPLRRKIGSVKSAPPASSLPFHSSLLPFAPLRLCARKSLSLVLSHFTFHSSPSCPAVASERRGIALRSARRRAAFSLLELLAAIAILISIILMLAIIFSESDKTWDMGTSRADVNGAGRAALDLLAHDIEFSLADKTLPFSIAVDKDKLKSYDFTNDQICAVSLENDNYNGQRAVREVYYYVKEMEDDNNKKLGRYELMRGYYADEISDTADNVSPAGADYLSHCYFNTNGPWYAELNRPGSAGVVAENVTGFRVYISGTTYDPMNGPTNFYFATPSGLPGNAYNSDDGAGTIYSNSLPMYVDIVLDLLDEKHAIQVAATTGTDQRDLLERNVRRFTTRVYFQNRDGYKIR